MSASLIFRLHKIVPLDDVLRNTRFLLLRMLKLSSVPALICELPPGKKATGIKLEGRLIDSSFPGAYIEFEGREESVVDLHVFESGPSRENLLVGCGGVGAPTSDVLAAAVTIASAELMGSTIVDAGTHWTDMEECTATELFVRLALQEQQSDFSAAIELVYRKQCGHIKDRM